MSVEVVTALFLIAVPIVFNVAFFELGRPFDYPTSSDAAGRDPAPVPCGQDGPAAPLAPADAQRAGDGAAGGPVVRRPGATALASS
jgi:hypothetical protein